MNDTHNQHTNATVMVVDDNPTNVELLCEMLEDAGYSNLIGISDPRKVEPYCEEALPHLILLDIRMPEPDGHTLLRRLSERWRDQCPPIIVLTAQTDEETRDRALGAGARDFLTKPFDHREALQRIRNSLNSHSQYLERVYEARTLEQMVAERTRELERQALQEPVTGMPNRRAILSGLREPLARGDTLAVAFIALADLEEIAHLHGYPAMEQLLRLVGRLLSRKLEGAEVGCWGNAEFVCYRREPNGSRRLEQDLEALIHELTRTFQVGDLRLKTGLRIGMSRSDRDSSEAEQLVRYAALALPRDDTGAIRQFDASLEAALRYRGEIEHELRNAVSNNELSLLFQPKINLASASLAGAETLLRWHNPRLGQVSPGEFIPLAEGSGEILTLGRWVLEEAIRQAAQWYKAGLMDRDRRMAVNVATRQLTQPDLAEEILTLLDGHGLPSDCLEVEVTESGLMEDVAQARRQLQRLAEAGVSVAIDDFGTGYSSLAYLKDLPVSTLKIDRTFVNAMGDHQEDQNLVRTVIAMAHNFGCSVVAEGIETPAQARALLGLGCERAQGFWFARPMDADRFEQTCHQPPDWCFGD
ncbi:MAG: EAL domain-containing response regulator [Pseudomonadota bacterium]